MIFTSTTPWKPPNSFFKKSLKFEFWFLTKSWNHHNFVNISPTLVIDTSMERSSRVLHHGNRKMWKFFKKFEIDEIEFCPYPEFLYAEKRNRPGFVNTSPTLVIDTSMERFSRVLQHGNQKIWFFFFKKVRNWIWLVFWLMLKSWNQHSSRSHLYVDIGDASSSLWGSTSSFIMILTSFQHHESPIICYCEGNWDCACIYLATNNFSKSKQK